MKSPEWTEAVTLAIVVPCFAGKLSTKIMLFCSIHVDLGQNGAHQ